MTGLRERKKLDTRRALSDAALKLAFEGGLDSVTREAIAELAGVSLRTFNNYFTGKYEALAYRQTERLRRSIAVLRERPADEPLWTSITEAVIAPLEEDFRDATGEENKIPSRTELAEVRKLLMRPEIRDAANKELFDEWLEVVAERTGTDPDRDIYPRLVTCRGPCRRRRGDGALREGGSAGADHHADPVRLRRGGRRSTRTRQVDEEEEMTVEAADVVISGAGPNGLMLACELALAGVRPVVLDKLPGPSDEPKANGLVGQVIRQLDMRDLYHAFGGDEGPPKPAYGWMFAGVSLNFLGIEDNPMHALLHAAATAGAPPGEAGA